jgi:hypothetical protein
MADLGSTLVDAFVRDNRVLPPVLAVLALFIIAWILAGAFMGEPDQETVAHKADLAQSDLAQSDLAQSDGGRSGGDPAPGVENRDVNSYAAYRSKDPFRELIAPERTTSDQPSTTTPEQTTPESTTGPVRRPGGPGAGGANRDRDADGVSDRREQRVGTDPTTPDTDGDGTPDGSDDDANGRPDTGGTVAGSGTYTTPGAGQPGRGGNRGRGGNGDGLLNSGGILPLP